jgi:hypothetical protein
LRVATNNDLAETAERLDVAAWVHFGVGSAAAATAVVLYVLGFRRRGSEVPSVALLPSPTGFQLSARR